MKEKTISSSMSPFPSFSSPSIDQRKFSSRSVFIWATVTGEVVDTRFVCSFLFIIYCIEQIHRPQDIANDCVESSFWPILFDSFGGPRKSQDTILTNLREKNCKNSYFQVCHPFYFFYHPSTCLSDAKHTCALLKSFAGLWRTSNKCKLCPTKIDRSSNPRWLS